MHKHEDPMLNCHFDVKFTMATNGKVNVDSIQTSLKWCSHCNQADMPGVGSTLVISVAIHILALILLMNVFTEIGNDVMRVGH